MFKTGVFCTEAERKKMQDLVRAARTTPVMLVGGVGLSHEAHKDLFRELTACARKHGLPDIAGEYGLTEEGEFVTVDEQRPTVTVAEHERQERDNTRP